MKRFARASVVFAGIFLLTAAPLRAAEPAPEYRVKAAFIFNFIRFTEWPAALSTAPVRVGVMGPESAVEAVDATLDGKRVGERSVVVKRFSRPEDARGFDVVYVAYNDFERARSVVQAVAGRPVLTITESDRFLSVGSLINFYISESTVRFAVNATLLDRSSIMVSSQMLQFAAIVRTGG